MSVVVIGELDGVILVVALLHQIKHRRPTANNSTVAAAVPTWITAPASLGDLFFKGAELDGTELAFALRASRAGSADSAFRNGTECAIRLHLDLDSVSRRGLQDVSSPAINSQLVWTCWDCT